MTFFATSCTLLDVTKDMTGEDVQMEDFEFVKTFSEQVKTLVKHLENDTVDLANEPLKICLQAIQLTSYLNFQYSYDILEKEIRNRMSESNLASIQNTLPKPMFEQLLIRKNDLEFILLSGHKQVIPKIQILDANYYAEHGKLWSLEYCLEIRKEVLDFRIMDRVCRNGHLSVIQFLHSIGREGTIYAMDLASSHGHLSIVQFFHSIGESCSAATVDWASEYGHLSVIQFFHTLGKGYTKNAIYFASENGHLPVIQFLHSIGKDCTTQAMDIASKNGHFEIVQFLHSIGKNSSIYILGF